MPELPDVELYVTKLREMAVGQRLESFRAFNPFVLRSVAPTPKELEGLTLVGVRRLGKRIVLEFENDLFLIVHLMIAGRFRWVEGTGKGLAGKIVHASLRFGHGMLFLTEAGSKKRASISIVQGSDELKKHDPGGIEVLESSLEQFAAALRAESHTVKKSLTNPHLFSGIGNAYSDEILHAARLSPLKQTRSLSDAEIDRLFEAANQVLTSWSTRLEQEFANRFPGAGDITAFRPDFAVHGRFGRPCPVCGKPVQRIVYADNEANYCAVCQNGGKLLADRALSRLLKGDWPDTV